MLVQNEQELTTFFRLFQRLIDKNKGEVTHLTTEILAWNVG